MKTEGSIGCSEKACTNPPDLSTPCGKKCWFDIDSHRGQKASFEYTFRGEKFQIYGTYDTGHGSINVFVDGDLIAVVSQKGTRQKYALQYTSDLLLYGDHTIRVETADADMELYKFAYWPAVKGHRLNSTDLRPFWNVEKDNIGGLQEWANEHSHTKEAKTATLSFFKVWIYGGFDPGHGNFSMKINNKEHIINLHSGGDRKINTLVYETEYMPFDTYKFSIMQNEEDVLFNCIYYLPFPEPTPVPFSVSIDEIKITGPKGCNTEF